MQTNLRPAQTQDIAQIAEIEKQIQKTGWSQEEFQSSYQDGHAIQILEITQAEKKEIAGYWVAMSGYEEAHLLNIGIEKKYQNLGFGKVLIENLKLWARATNSHTIWLEVRKSNKPAIALYQKTNFQKIAERKNYYSAKNGNPSEDAIIMKLEI